MVAELEKFQGVMSSAATVDLGVGSLVLHGAIL